MKKRLLASLLSLCMVMTMLPATALAADETMGDEPPVICAELEGCVDGAHDADCPLYVALEETGNEPADEPDEPTVVELFQARIDALPTAEELSAMEAEERDAAYLEAITIDDAIRELPNEEQALLETTKLDALFEWFNSQVTDQPDGDSTEGTEFGPWDVSANEDGSVTASLTENGDGTYTLTISGTGAMKDFGTNDAPWKTALSNIEGGTYTDKTTSGSTDNQKTFYKISEVVIEDGVTSIGNNAFSYTDVSKITIPNSVTTIGTGVFTWTLQLKEINIPASVTNLNHTESNGAYTYYNTFDGAFNLEKITVDAGSQNYAVAGGILIGKIPGTENEWMIVNCPDKLAGTTQINASAFDGYNITAVGRTAFSACTNLTSIDLPDTVKDIQAGAFNKCYSLTSFTVPAGVTEFGGNFSGCSSLTSVDWNNVTSITVSDVFGSSWADETDGQEHACAVTTTDLSKVTNIAAKAFQNSRLESATFSDSSELYIGSQAFANCENWTVSQLDFSNGTFVSFDAFDESNVSNIEFPTQQIENAEVLLIRGQRVFYFYTFDSAIDAAQDGDILRLNSDTKLSSVRSINSSSGTITLDLNGHVLEFTGKNNRLFTVNGGTLNIQDSTPKAEHTYRVENGLWVLDENGDNTLCGGVITGGNHTAGGGAIMVTNNGTLNMSGGNIVGNQTSANGSGGIGTSGTCYVNITGGSVMGNISTSGGAHIADLAGDENCGYSISGGTFTTPLKSGWCTPGFYPHDNGDDTYTASLTQQGAARIGNTYYDSFNDAFDAANKMDSATIVVLRDNELKTACRLDDAEKTITVDLNGYVLKYTGINSGRLFTVLAGTLNIQDSRPMTKYTYRVDAESGKWILDENGESTLYGGVITGGNSGDNSGGAIMASGANAKVNISGGNIIGNQSNGASGGVATSGGTINISGGSVMGNISTQGGTNVSDLDGSGIKITGGTFTTEPDKGMLAEGYSAVQTTYNGSDVYVVTTGQENTGYHVVTIPAQVYTGTAIEPTVTVYNENETLDKDGYSVKYENNTNVGSATATVTIDGQDQDIEVTFQIIRDESPLVTLPDQMVTYGASYTMTATAKTSAGTEISDENAITIAYYLNAECTEGSELDYAPTDAGTYYVKATLQETDNYAEAYTVAALTIKRADFQVSAKGYAGTYDGQSHSISVTAEDDVTVTYSRNGYTYAEENPTFTNAGTYTVYYKVEKTNHNDVTGYLTVNIGKAPLTATYSGEVIRFGQTPELSVVVTGFVNGETAATAAGYQAPAISNAPTSIGQYTLSPTGGTADNYTFNYVSGTLVIRSNSSNSGNSSSTTYSITAPSNVTGGDISVSPSRASYNSTVTITVDPDNGYELDTLTVTDEDGNRISLTNAGNDRYTFKMPRGEVTINATFTEVEDVPEQIGSFTDVSTEDWFAEAVQYMLDNEMMNGTSATTFGPNTTTTRGMIVTILYRLEGEPDAAASSFTDVASNMYYADAINWAAANGIVNGITTTTFGPDNAITREQMAAILYRYAQYKGYDVTASNDLGSYTDASQISAYATAAMQWANAEGLITGNTTTTINPIGNATRAEVATILMRFCENIAG